MTKRSPKPQDKVRLLAGPQLVAYCPKCQTLWTGVSSPFFVCVHVDQRITARCLPGKVIESRTERKVTRKRVRSLAVRTVRELGA